MCHTDDETQLHLFVQCPKVQELRTIVENDIKRASGSSFTLSYSSVTMHSKIRSTAAHEILSIYKQSVWQIRGALYSRGDVNVDIESELMALYRWKVGWYVRAGVG